MRGHAADSLWDFKHPLIGSFDKRSRRPKAGVGGTVGERALCSIVFEEQKAAIAALEARLRQRQADGSGEIACAEAEARAKAAAGEAEAWAALLSCHCAQAVARTEAAQRRLRSQEVNGLLRGLGADALSREASATGALRDMLKAVAEKDKIEWDTTRSEAFRERDAWTRWRREAEQGFSDRLRSLEDELATVRRRSAGEKKLLETALSAATSELDTAQSRYRVETALLESQKKRAEAAAADLAGRLEKTGAALAAHEAKARALQASSAARESSAADAFHEELVSARKLSAESAGKLAEAEERLLQARSVLAARQERVKAAEEEAEEIRVELRGSQRRAAVLEAELAEVRARGDDSGGRLMEAQREAAALRAASDRVRLQLDEAAARHSAAADAAFRLSQAFALFAGDAVTLAGAAGADEREAAETRIRELEKEAVASRHTIEGLQRASADGAQTGVLSLRLDTERSKREAAESRIRTLELEADASQQAIEGLRRKSADSAQDGVASLRLEAERSKREAAEGRVRALELEADASQEAIDGLQRMVSLQASPKPALTHRASSTCMPLQDTPPAEKRGLPPSQASSHQPFAAHASPVAARTLSEPTKPTFSSPPSQTRASTATASPPPQQDEPGRASAPAAAPIHPTHPPEGPAGEEAGAAKQPQEAKSRGGKLKGFAKRLKRKWAGKDAGVDKADGRDAKDATPPQQGPKPRASELAKGRGRGNDEGDDSDTDEEPEKRGVGSCFTGGRKKGGRRRSDQTKVQSLKAFAEDTHGDHTPRLYTNAAPAEAVDPAPAPRLVESQLQLQFSQHAVESDRRSSLSVAGGQRSVSLESSFGEDPDSRSDQPAAPVVPREQADVEVIAIDEAPVTTAVFHSAIADLPPPPAAPVQHDDDSDALTLESASDGGGVEQVPQQQSAASSRPPLNVKRSIAHDFDDSE
ncbi:hypothetical protein DIPPA_31179 [Diplonema papillatum]|nr:hypothetical protein DIPPA_31179 [Diplonema papillatum]